jgi:hypothetical protein
MDCLSVLAFKSFWHREKSRQYGVVVCEAIGSVCFVLNSATQIGGPSGDGKSLRDCARLDSISLWRSFKPSCLTANFPGRSPTARCDQRRRRILPIVSTQKNTLVTSLLPGEKTRYGTRSEIARPSWSYPQASLIRWHE